MKRRTVLVQMRKCLAVTALAAPAASIAQRATRPIRPRNPGRPGVPLGPGRIFPRTSGVAGPATEPGVFTVSSVQARESVVRLRDADGRSADVYVDPDIFDVSTLEAGDEVAVDFFVPNDSDDRLEAASVWKLERVRP